MLNWKQRLLCDKKTFLSWLLDNDSRPQERENWIDGESIQNSEPMIPLGLYQWVSATLRIVLH